MKEIVTQNSFPASEQPRVLFEEEEATDLREYWFIIYRHRRAALAFLLLTIFLTAIAIRWEGGLYTAKTTLYVPSQNRGVLDSPEPITAGTNTYETQRKLLTSRSLDCQGHKNSYAGPGPIFQGETDQSPKLGRLRS